MKKARKFCKDAFVVISYVIVCIAGVTAIADWVIQKWSGWF